MALIQPSSSRLWSKWVGHMTGGEHGIQLAAIVREDGGVLAASPGFTISKHEILELRKYFRSHAFNRCHSQVDGKGHGHDQGDQGQIESMFRGLRKYFRSRSHNSTGSCSSDDSHDGQQGQCDSQYPDHSVHMDTQQRHLLTVCLQGRIFIVRSRTPDRVQAFSGPTNVIVVRSQRLYLIGVCPSRQVVDDASQFLAELKADLIYAGY